MAALAALLSAAAAMAADAVGPRPAPADVSSLLQPILQRHNLPGMVGLVLRGRQCVAAGAVGVRKLGSPEKVALDDRFHLGSCTKSMTATLLAMLIEQGKLSWTTTIGEVFPPWAASMKPEYRQVTLEQLLTHRAGVVANLPREEPWLAFWKPNLSSTEQRFRMIEGVLSYEPASPPGTQYLYSNAGYSIAGAMAEKVTGQGYEELMQKRLFGPLGMSSAGFGAPGTCQAVDQPWGHTEAGKPLEPGPRADNPPAISPAGRVHATIGDWAKYVALHLRGDQGDARLLKAATFEKLHAPAEGPGPQYAMGWGVTERRWGHGRVLTHTGSNTFWFAVVWMAPLRDFSLLVAANQGGKEAAKGCDDAAATLIRFEIEGK